MIGTHWPNELIWPCYAGWARLPYQAADRQKTYLQYYLTSEPWLQACLTWSLPPLLCAAVIRLLNLQMRSYRALGILGKNENYWISWSRYTILMRRLMEHCGTQDPRRT